MVLVWKTASSFLTLRKVRTINWSEVASGLVFCVKLHSLQWFSHSWESLGVCEKASWPSVSMLEELPTLESFCFVAGWGGDGRQSHGENFLSGTTQELKILTDHKPPTTHLEQSCLRSQSTGHFHATFSFGNVWAFVFSFYTLQNLLMSWHSNLALNLGTVKYIPRIMGKLFFFFFSFVLFVCLFLGLVFLFVLVWVFLFSFYLLFFFLAVFFFCKMSYFSDNRFLPRLISKLAGRWSHSWLETARVLVVWPVMPSLCYKIN